MWRRVAFAVGLVVAALLVLVAMHRRGVPETGAPIRIGDITPAEPSQYRRPLGTAVQNAYAQEDAAYRRLLISRFTSVTPENALKWSYVEPERGKFDFREADAIVDFAERTHKRVRGHTLVWDQQLPDWVAKHDWSRQELIAVLKEHIQTVMRHFRGKIAEWDVVNEPLEDNGRLTPSVFLKVLGPSYIPLAFRLAHEADPHARLFLNEIAAEPGVPKAKALYDLVKGLKQEGVPIDGVGLQNHRTVDSFPTEHALQNTFAAYRRLGLDVAITEMDVDTQGDDAGARQAQAYAAAAKACAAAANCTGLTVWGITDDHSWLGEDAHALLYADGGRPKPAANAVLGVLRR
jgi:endo-1,4-beta-xylanase